MSFRNALNQIRIRPIGSAVFMIDSLVTDIMTMSTMSICTGQPWKSSARHRLGNCMSGMGNFNGGPSTRGLHFDGNAFRDSRLYVAKHVISQIITRDGSSIHRSIASICLHLLLQSYSTGAMIRNTHPHCATIGTA